MDPTIKKETLRLLTYGLYVLTVTDGQEVAAGTVTWLSQTSFTPPLVMVGVKFVAELVNVGLHQPEARPLVIWETGWSYGG